MLDAYSEGKIDRLFLVHNEFVNSMTQKPVVAQLLPASGVGDDDQLQAHWDYIYEPDAGELLDDVLMRYIESQVYRGAVENFACEMAAKMVAMKSATDNAGEIIENLQLEVQQSSAGVDYARNFGDCWWRSRRFRLDRIFLLTGGNAAEPG